MSALVNHPNVHSGGVCRLGEVKRYTGLLRLVFFFISVVLSAHMKRFSGLRYTGFFFTTELVLPKIHLYAQAFEGAADPF